MTQQAPHKTVLQEEAVSALAIIPDGIYVDATFGRGGHSRSILAQLNASGSLLVLDKDVEAIAEAIRLAEKDKRVIYAHTPFSRLLEICQQYDLAGKVNGVLFDLGVSSPQLDDPDRGFSFMRDGPLDMRMNTETGITAAEWVNKAAEAEIADVLYHYGEEKHSRRMARAIVKARQEAPITTTARLAEIVKEANPAWERDKHPATRAFQAIRIYINEELDEIRLALQQAIDVLAIGGRMAVISFHSLEDRIVKRFIAEQARGDRYPRGLPIPADQLNPVLRKVGGAEKPSKTEIESNPRARSAVLRVAEKIGQAVP